MVEKTYPQRQTSLGDQTTLRATSLSKRSNAMPQKPTRRDLIKTSAAAAAAAAFATPKALAAAQPEAEFETPLILPRGIQKGDKIRFAAIGVGGKGDSDTADAARSGELVAFAEIDANVRADNVKKYPNAVAFTDFRQMLDAMGKHIDAVTVSTPDHTHAPAAAMAIKMGKHVFCQKPLTRTVYEARRLGELARRHRVATQMGNQGTARDDLRRAAALLKAGAFGVVKEVHCWTDRCGGWWPQGVERPSSKACPNHVAWDLWLGPSPWRDYADGYHPFAWRGWWDFGSGALGDIGCHQMNLPFMALDLRDPIAIQATTSGHNKDSYPNWSVVTYEFGERNGRAPLKMIWYDGGKKPPSELVPEWKYSGNGAIFVCEKATLYTENEYGTNAKLAGGAPLPEIEFERSPGHFEEWVQAIKGGKPARSNVPDYSGPLTEMVVLGNLAVWANGPRLEWDARRLAVKSAPEYDALIKPPYRKGWSL